MLGPRYIEANIDEAYYRQRCYQIHQEKLRNIEETGRTQKKTSKKQDQLRQKVRESRMRNHVFQYNEKNASINRENEVLMTKLIEISKGKWSSVHGHRKSSTFGFRPHSLNVTSRKQESERITSENHALARRILEKPASINKSILERDYYNSLKYQLLIRKSHKARMPHFAGRPGQLPPIDLATGVSTSRVIGQRSQSKPQNRTTIESDPLQMSAPILEPTEQDEAIKVSEEEGAAAAGEKQEEEEEKGEVKGARNKKKQGTSSSPNEKKKVGAYYSMDPFKSPKNANNKSGALVKQQTASQDIQDIKDDLEKKKKEEEPGKAETKKIEEVQKSKEKSGAKKQEDSGEKKIAEIYKSQSKKSLKKEASQKKVELVESKEVKSEEEKKEAELSETAKVPEEQAKPSEAVKQEEEKKEEGEEYEKDVWDEESDKQDVKKKETTNIMNALGDQEGPKPSADVVQPGQENETKN